jgi:hypothetical protein
VQAAGNKNGVAELCRYRAGRREGRWLCFTRDMVCHGHPLEVVEVSRWEETDERRFVDDVIDVAQSGGLMIYEYFLRQCLNDIKD